MILAILTKKKRLFYSILLFLILYIWRHLKRKAWLCYSKTEQNLSILSKCPTILRNIFEPCLYLQHHLLQTMIGSLLSFRGSNISYQPEEVQMPRGGHTTLFWPNHDIQYYNSKRSQILVLVIPGITGYVQDNYVKDLVNALREAGYRSVVYQTRFSGGKLSLPDEGYVDIFEDLRITIDYIKDKEKDMKLFGIGHSYGANLLMNYLGIFADDNRLIGGISLANPFNFLLGENKIRRSMCDKKIASFMQKATLRSTKHWSDTIRHKLNLDELSTYKYIRDFDENFTIKLYGYDTPDEYYWAISSCRRLKSIKVPLFMLHAEDDPIAEAKSFIRKDIEKGNQNVILMMTPKGGHQGWVEGFLSLKRWYLGPTIEFLNAVVDIEQK